MVDAHGPLVSTTDGWYRHTVDSMDITRHRVNTDT